MKKVLVADDDPRLAEALSVRLTANGYNVLVTHDGQSAVELAFAERPDLVILDVSMPQGNGFFVAEQLRADPRTEKTPVIFMTGQGDPAYFDEAMHQDGIAFLDKPFDSNVLLPLVECALDYF